MTSALIPIWILGGAALGLVILNVMTAGGSSSGDRIDRSQMNQGVTSPRLDAGRPGDLSPR